MKLRQNIVFYSTIVALFHLVNCQGQCSHPLSQCDNSDPLNPVFLGCKPNAILFPGREFCQCISSTFWDETSQTCKDCHSTCKHLTCVGDKQTQCSFWEKDLTNKDAKEYHPYNLFSSLNVDPNPTKPAPQFILGKNLADFEMNNVCTGILFDQLIYHMVSETKGYTFVQDVAFETGPIMKTPHEVIAQKQTRCVIGPHQKLIYGGIDIVQKFVYSKQDTEALGYNLIARISKDSDGNDIEFKYKFSTQNPHPDGTLFNILLPIEDSIILLAASETWDYLHIFDYQIMGLESNQLKLAGHPLKLLSMGEKSAIIVYKELRKCEFIITNLKREAIFKDFFIETNMQIRHMDSSVIYDPSDNKYAPLVAILYDDNLIDVFRGENFTPVTLEIPQWAGNTLNKGFVLLLPYSDHLVVAKQGHTTILFKNYIDSNLNEREVETAFRSIAQITLSPSHKILTVYDQQLIALTQFFVYEIRCGNDPLILSCSGVFINQKVECVQNAVWNILQKKCFCIGGYYLDIITR